MDEDPLVRKNTYTIFARTSQFKSGVENILSWGIVKILIERLVTERIDIQCLVLETLYHCIRMGPKPWIPDDAIACDTINVLTELITPLTTTDVKVLACNCIMALSLSPEGKKTATNVKTISILSDSLMDLKNRVRSAAAGALMSISIDCDAKRIMVRENTIAILMKLLDDKDESVLLNCVKTITNCAEDYRGRFQLHACIKKLETFKSCQNIQLASAAAKAMEVITWRP